MAGEEQPRRRRSDRYSQTPERVEQAAGQMGSPSWTGVQRGYVPQSAPRQGYATGPQNPVPSGPRQGPAAARPGNGYPAQGAGTRQGGYIPQNAPQNTNGGYPGQGTGPMARTAAGGQQGYPNPGAGSGGQWTGSQQKYQTASNRAADFRGYVAMSAGPENPEPRKRKSPVPVIAAVLAVMVLCAGGVFAAMSYSRTKRINDRVEPYNNLFVNGVYVDGIHLGGMTPEQALNSVQSQIQQRNDAWSVTLTYQGETQAVINAGMLGMSVDIGEVMNNAWLQGHVGDYEERYAAMEALEETPYEAYTAVPSGDTSVIDTLMAQIKARIDLAPVNAELIAFDTTLDYPFTFSDDRAGRTLDTKPVIEQLYQMVSTMDSGTIELEPEIIQPRVTKIALQKHYMLRSSVYTPISTSSPEERNNNIRRAFELINGYVLNPGNNFSFNSVVGERTEANGFFPAIEYAYNEHVMGIGGGVCQASTTLYQAAVCAGLQIVKREPHSDAVNYTEYGKDATVYWMYNKKIDFVFKNNTSDPLYIVAAVQEDPSNKRRLIARVSMYGEDMGDVRYEMEAQVVEEIPPPVEPVYIKDKQAEYVTYTDQEKSVSKAKPGYVVKSYRVQYTGNVLTDRKELYTDTYEPRAERIYVGIKKREET